MYSTAPAVRVTKAGKLEQEDELAAVLGVLQVMIGTTSTHWRHAPWFGLYEAFAEAAKREKQDHEGLRDAINQAFQELGAERYVVQSVTATDPDQNGRRQFDLVLSCDDQALFGKVHLP